WIFQANPNKYAIFDSLDTEIEEYWNLNQHARHVQKSDRVLIWISGANAGIYAMGTVMTEPLIRSDSAKGIEYWADPNNGTRAKPRVLVKYDRSFVARPILKDFLICDPELWNMQIVKSPRGTNFQVSPAEWNAIRTWIDRLQ